MNDNLPYGVSGMIGNKYITKLRVIAVDWNRIRFYLLANCIDHSFLFTNVKVLKNGKLSKYVHFSVLCTQSELATIKIMIRVRKIRDLEEEIEQLSYKSHQLTLNF